jgi:uncharacterized BrkB/YihY/UPF0761 family membrane protein
MDSENLRLRPEALWIARPPAPAGWTRKTFALAMHLACLGLFGLTVVLPVVGPLGSGELAREFQPVQQACAAWVDWLLSLR